MKRQIITQSFRSNLSRSILLAIFLIISIIPVVRAQAFSNPQPYVEIKYVGLLREKPVFRVEYNTQNRNVIELSITDEDGRLLFSDKLNQQAYLKNFQVDADEHENFKLILTIVDVNLDTRERKRQSYLITGKVDLSP